MVLKEFMDRMRNRNEGLKAAQEQDKIMTTIQERKKTANERELERFKEEERQAMIKVELEGYRKKAKAKQMETTVFNGKPLFKGGATILKNNHKLLDMKKSQEGGSMYFR